MKDLNINVIQIIKDAIEEKEKNFSLELGKEYGKLLAEHKELYDENHTLWTTVFHERIQGEEKGLAQLNEDIIQRENDLQKMAVSDDFDETSFYSLRTTIKEKKVEKETLVDKLQTSNERYREAIQKEMRVTHGLAAYPVNRYTLALDWIKRYDSENGQIDIEQKDYYEKSLKTLASIMEITPSVVDFDIAENVGDVGFRFTSLAFGNLRLEVEPFLIRENVESHWGNLEIEDVIRYGFNVDESPTAIRTAFSDRLVMFEWFRTQEDKTVIEAIFIENPNAKEDKEKFIRIGMKPEAITKHSALYTVVLNGNVIELSFSEFPNSI